MQLHQGYRKIIIIAKTTSRDKGKCLTRAVLLGPEEAGVSQRGCRRGAARDGLPGKALGRQGPGGTGAPAGRTSVTRERQPVEDRTGGSLRDPAL